METEGEEDWELVAESPIKNAPDFSAFMQSDSHAFLNDSSDWTLSINANPTASSSPLAAGKGIRQREAALTKFKNWYIQSVYAIHILLHLVITRRYFYTICHMTVIQVRTTVPMPCHAEY
jgi:hypothetical protein